MLSRVFLAAGVAALAIAAPASAKPGGGHGNGGGQGNGNGGGGGAAFSPPGGGGGGGGHGHGGGGGGGEGRGHGGGGGGGGAPVFMGGGGGHGHGGGGGDFARQQQRVERQQSRGFERQQARQVERQQSRGFERQQARNIERQQSRGFERQQARNVERQQARGFERQQTRNVERQQMRGFERQQARSIDRQQMRGFERQQARMSDRQQLRGFERKQQAFVSNQFAAQQFGGQAFEGRQAKFANGNFAQNFNAAPYQVLSYGNDVRVLPVAQVQQFVGVPVGQIGNFAALSPLPASIQYLYPDTPDYYYQYGDGYLYQVDRGNSLIEALIPLLAGGYLPGQYLPRPYMASTMPSYYGFNNFYPDYGDVCNRYYEGVVYQVDCDDGYVENVIPMYASGYGVGQLLPSAYSYYNVPMQYRSMYYDNPNYGYWYSPGAIYQYDQRSSMITSVAALLSPGFTVGQALPMGYDVYNVPYAYRQTYYDTPNAWYRYSNGYIYQVDPVTQVVTAMVASLLT